LAFLGKTFVERWLDRNLEKYKSELSRKESEHETKFALLHEKRAAIIAELYRLIVEMLRSISKSAQGIHQYADHQVPTPRHVRQTKSVEYFNTAVADFRAFEKHFEDNRIYLSNNLIDKINQLRKQVADVLKDLEASHVPPPPDFKGLPPSIHAIWNAQKSLRLLVQPIREEIEIEFRGILGVIDSSTQ
jgi:hypothetical protein